MILVFDVETTGLNRKDLADDDPAQPNLLQISAKLVSPKRKRLARMTVMIRPRGWTIETEAEAHHHISEQMASTAGVGLEGPLATFRDLVADARTIVAHHAQFDWMIVMNALKRMGANGHWWITARPKLRCTMELSAPVLGIPGEFKEPKFPTLEEAHAALVGPYESKHDGEEDAEACERVWWALEERGAIPPQVPLSFPAQPRSEAAAYRKL